MRSKEELAVGGASCQTGETWTTSLVTWTRARERAQQLRDDTAWMSVRVAWKRRYVRQETSLTVLPVSSFSTCMLYF